MRWEQMCGILDGAFIKGTVRLSLFPKVLYLAANCSKILGEVYLSSGKGSWGMGPWSLGTLSADHRRVQNWCPQGSLSLCSFTFLLTEDHCSHVTSDWRTNTKSWGVQILIFTTYSQRFSKWFFQVWVLFACTLPTSVLQILVFTRLVDVQWSFVVGFNIHFYQNARFQMLIAHLDFFCKVSVQVLTHFLLFVLRCAEFFT